MEKKCCNFKVTETESGYRIEISGEGIKEKCKSAFESCCFEESIKKCFGKCCG